MGQVERDVRELFEQVVTCRTEKVSVKGNGKILCAVSLVLVGPEDGRAVREVLGAYCSRTGSRREFVAPNVFFRKRGILVHCVTGKTTA